MQLGPEIGLPWGKPGLCQVLRNLSLTLVQHSGPRMGNYGCFSDLDKPVRNSIPLFPIVYKHLACHGDKVNPRKNCKF